jgi:ABC-2 type transport system permease protein
MTSATTMSTPTLDVSGTARVPFARLIGVEVRKMADTRAGMWLLIAIGLITAASVTIWFFAAPDDQHTFLSFMIATGSPQGTLLPVLGILLVTSEWGQRTTLTTFALEPSRLKVIAAKVAAALLVGVVAVVLAVAIAALATILAGAPNAWQNVGLDDLGKFALLQFSGLLMGMAFGLILLNSAAAIVLFFVLPNVFSFVANIWGALADAAPWIDTGTAQQPLLNSPDLTGEQWAQLVTSSAIWILLPFVVGLVRVTRAEVK